MLGERTTFEWQVGESDNWDDFEPIKSILDGGEIVEKAGPEIGDRWQGLRRVLRGLLVVVVLAAGVAAYGFWRDYQAGVRQIRTDIQGTIDTEAWAWQYGEEPVADSLLDSEADGGWVQNLRWSQEWRRRWAGEEAQMPAYEIDHIELRDDLALVEIVATQTGEPWMSAPYRETRFYRQVGNRWLRTAPRTEFWGASRTVETDHFHFEFHQRDAEALASTIEEIDALYLELRRDVGLGPPPIGEQLTIKILPNTDVISWRFMEDTLTISSPALLRVPENVPQAARLAESILYPLARRVVKEAVPETERVSRWSPMVEGVRHWLSWENSAVPSGWRYHVEGLLKERLEDASYRQSVYSITSKGKPWDRSDWWTRIAAAEAVVDYAIERYGRDQLPALLQAMDEHDTWNTLIPAVFGVSLEEFEAGWQAYLAMRFGSDDPVPAETQLGLNR